ncbi:ABC-2 transporter permease [Dethiothermospora halolimnae]|uniref:ABC-2 transporter permease n=1 Tax=Dethiothermospora halolimnae TaxID=3114390 RepID=UPI003CCC31E7
MGYIIFKDIYSCRKSILIYMVIAIGFIMTGFGGENSNFVGIVIMMMTYGTATRIQYDEEKHMGYSFLRTLPIRSYKIVASKFLTSFILAVFTVVYTFGLLVILPKGQINDEGIIVIVATFSVALILTGIFHLMVYKYGSSKALTYTRIFFFSFFFIPFIGSYITDLLKKITSKEAVMDMINKISGLFENLTISGNIVLLLIVGFLVYFLLMLRSIIIFNKKSAV